MTLIHYFKEFNLKCLTAAKALLPDTNVDNFVVLFVIYVESLILVAFVELHGSL